MSPTRHHRSRIAALGASIAVALTGCSLSSITNPSATNVATGLPTASGPGGTVNVWSVASVDTWDPQRIGNRNDMSFATRNFIRTLTAYSADTNPDAQRELMGDLATNTGKASSDLKTWQFTLRPGLTWQDGSAITCQDLKYGIARTFATKEIKGGPAYAISVLNVPKKANGTSSYLGPYDKSKANKAGRKAFDAAVSCKGSIITFKLARPESDFNELVTLPTFAPYQAKHDNKANSTFSIFSSGPYKLAGNWVAGTGGTFVRNTKWRPESDPIRRAFPDALAYQEKVPVQTMVERILAGGNGGSSALSISSAPPAIQQQIVASADLRGRSINPDTTLMDYLAPNFTSAVMKKPDARAAFALSTDRDAYVTALGGDTAARAATSLIPAAIRMQSSSPTSTTTTSSSTTAPRPTGTKEPTVSTRPSFDTPQESPSSIGLGATTSPEQSDVERSKAALTAAGMKLPVPVTVAYRQSDSMDKAMAALMPKWKAGGFNVNLKPISGDYFTAISKPNTKIDAYWANWAPEWASASTILPPLFDSRINLTKSSTGRDYGSYKNDKTNAAMDGLSKVANRTEREKGWLALDGKLRGEGAYVPLAQRKALYVAGSDVRSFSSNEVVGGYVEFAGVGVSP